ncbi:hypothetical protein E0L36_22630 [Streptomyces sp. AJS327]|uniref:flavoprotein n=1 Tax=Streptomyces sp. AJS327 TaxID=2545265 RepID=UPI0015DE23D3|nr:flavoprotein [Streptomyces sp. AJS327]MBA0053570.1 hypothetical protein [Streptomyces sp. AJS327]
MAEHTEDGPAPRPGADGGVPEASDALGSTDGQHTGVEAPQDSSRDAAPDSARAAGQEDDRAADREAAGTDGTTTGVPGVPALGARKLLYFGTGSIGVMFMPMWVSWLRSAYPELTVRTVVTRSAERFVTRSAVTAFAGGQVLQDVWPDHDEPETGAKHVELAHWPDAVVVYPASFHFVSRLALGVADTPMLLALQCTRAPVVVAPALPPGGYESPAFQRHLETLKERPNVAVVPPLPGVSLTTGRNDASVVPDLNLVVPVLERLRASLAAEAATSANNTGGAPSSPSAGSRGSDGSGAEGTGRDAV